MKMKYTNRPIIIIPTGIHIPRINAKFVVLAGGGTEPPFAVTNDVMIGMLAIDPEFREFCNP